jgi:hypothetical protein
MCRPGARSEMLGYTHGGKVEEVPALSCAYTGWLIAFEVDCVISSCVPVASRREKVWGSGGTAPRGLRREMSELCSFTPLSLYLTG